MAKGESLEEQAKERTRPQNRWEKGTVLGPEMGLGAGLEPREKVDVPLDMPEDMDPEEGQRSEYLYDVYALPMPVVLVTTADLAGNVDVSPKNWCTHAGAYGFAFVCSTEHDCFMNIQATGEFVVNVPGGELVPKLHALARRGTPSWENELRRAGLTELPSKVVRPPRVAECRAHLECKVELLYEMESHREVKSSKQGTAVLIVGKVVAMSADAEVIQAPTYYDRIKAVKPIVLGPIWQYAVVEETRELPGAWEVEY